MKNLQDAIHLMLLGYGGLFVTVAIIAQGARGFVAIALLGVLLWLVMVAGRRLSALLYGLVRNVG